MAPLIMPDKDRHILQAERNKQFCESQKLCASKYQEWGMIVLFYASLHYVDAVLAQDVALPIDLQHPKDHFLRSQALAKCTSLSQIASSYLQLYDRSHDARYKCIQFPKGYALVLEANFYKPIESEVRRQLGLPD